MRRYLSIVLFLAVIGCQAPSRPTSNQTVEIAGRIENAEGKPLDGALIRWHYQDGSKEQIQSYSCATRDKGDFTLRALPGRYKVTIPPIVPVIKEKGAEKDKQPPIKTKAPDGVPEQYTTLKTTPWEITIPEGGKKDILLKLEP